jgi:hypothetical protein
MSKIRELLRERGPLTSDELPYSPNVTDKRKGVWVFDPTMSNVNNARGHGGCPAPVYYLREDHDIEDVIEKWCEVNEKVVSTSSNHSLRLAIHGHGPEYKEALSDMDVLEVDA